MRSPITARGVAALALMLTATACVPLDDAMVAIFGRSMRDQPSFDPYENTLLPAEGAVSFSSGNFPAALGRLNIGRAEPVDYVVPDFTQAATAIPPGTEVLQGMVNPVPADSASLARGQILFDRYCTVCHGAEGLGTGAQILERWPALQVYDLAGAAVQAYPDGYIYGMIRVGRGLMPQYGHQITHFDRWHIVNYVRRLQNEFATAQPAAADGGEG
jgi:mono/diheme cytochrome c family protein